MFKILPNNKLTQKIVKVFQICPSIEIYAKSGENDDKVPPVLGNVHKQLIG